MKFNYQTMEYEPADLIALIDKEGVTEETKRWARRELESNGWCDISSADAGEEPRVRN